MLAPGREILHRLVEIVRRGAFVATNDESDCRYCDYRGICGDVPAVVAASQAKLYPEIEIPGNQILAPLRELRRD